MTDWLNKTHVGDCRTLMRQMAADGVKVQTIVTSPPYWGLRDYGVEGQIGSEPTLREWVDTMVSVFDCAWDVLAEDGVLWLNLGDAYSQAGGRGEQGATSQRLGRSNVVAQEKRSSTKPPEGLKPKDMMGQPWRAAFALQDAGWYLRSDIVWHKPNPMPESVTDRPTKSHEYVFMLSKSEQYHYDAVSIAEPTTGNSHPRVGVAPGQPRSRPQGVNPKAVVGWAAGAGSHSAKDHSRARTGLKDSTKFGRGAGWRNKQNESFSGAISLELGNPKISAARKALRSERESRHRSSIEGGQSLQAEPDGWRNARTVWSIPTEPFSGAHFATFPQELARRCVLAGSRPGDLVLDPFMGSGTVAKVATDLGRSYIGLELNPASVKLQDDHRRTTIGMPF